MITSYSCQIIPAWCFFLPSSIPIGVCCPSAAPSSLTSQKSTPKFVTSILVTITVVGTNTGHNVSILALKCHSTIKIVYIKGPFGGTHCTTRKISTAIRRPYPIFSGVIMDTAQRIECLSYI